MTKAEAHRVLDSARNGANVSELDILTALRATGDLAPLRVFSRVEETGQHMPIPGYARAHLQEAA